MYDLNYHHSLTMLRALISAVLFIALVGCSEQDISVNETAVEVSHPSTSTNTNGLLVRLMQDGIRFTDKSKQRNTDVPLKDLKDYIKNQKLAEKHSLVLLFVDKEADTGDMVEVMDIFKNAGIKDIHIAGGIR